MPIRYLLLFRNHIRPELPDYIYHSLALRCELHRLRIPYQTMT